MAILKVYTAPHKILKQKALPVTEFDDNLRKLLNDMRETMHHGHGIGLAATQVGVLKQIMVLELGDNHDTDDEIDYPLFIINPQFISYSDEKITADEACLSVPGLVIPIERPSEVTLKYQDQFGKHQTLHAKGWLARALQHENDHLDGKVLIDYLSPLKRDMALRKIKKTLTKA